MTIENERRGRSNRRAGKDAQRRVRTWLQEHGAPSAEVTTGPHRGDIVTGVGDVNIEVTLETWEQIGKKANQSQADAQALGYSYWVVCKPRRGIGDIGQAWCITSLAQWWRMHLENDELRREVEGYRKALRQHVEENLAGRG